MSFGIGTKRAQTVEFTGAGQVNPIVLRGTNEGNLSVFETALPSKYVLWFNGQSYKKGEFVQVDNYTIQFPFTLETNDVIQVNFWLLEPIV